MKSLIRSKKAVSMVIVTIIIVAIAMFTAVGYWAIGLGSSFTKYEKIEFTSAHADYNPSTNIWTMSLILRNTGSTEAMIETSSILYDGKPASAYEFWWGGSNMTTNYSPETKFSSFTMIPGNITKELSIDFKGSTTIINQSPWQSGMTVEVIIHTPTGNQYPKMITLP